MLIIKITEELFDNESQTFVYAESPTTFKLEHSLLSVSKWESIYEKPFLTNSNKSTDEILTYIRMMLVDEVNEDDFRKLNSDHMALINNYIEGKHTATIITNLQKPKGKPETITSELIYYWMTMFNIPFAPCETWFLNRLLTLIQIASIKSGKPNRMSAKEVAAQNREINAQRRAMYRSRG